MNGYKWGSVALALAMALLLAVWLASGDIEMARDQVDEPAPQAAEQLARVQVANHEARMHQPRLRMQGQVEPWRSVTVSARVSATVSALPLQQGDTVSAGQTLLRLAEEDRPAMVARSRSRVRQLEADLAATERLRADNLTSRSEALRLESELAAARADLRRATLALEHLEPSAPFDGVINRRHVELGTLVQAGEPLLQLVQVDRIKVTGYAPQQEVTRLAIGQRVAVDLLDGRSLEGEVIFVASAADAETRSFRVEVKADNPERLRIAGASATLRVELPRQPAQFLSPALLSLGEDGRPGVLHVDAQDRVAFTPVRLLSVGTDGAWVAGLPPNIRLITRGGGFVSRGQRVTPVAAEQGN